VGNPINTNGWLHAPYFIFLRCAGRYSDAELLERFGLSTYQRAPTIPHLGRCAILADADDWVLIADDWYYTLWHLQSTRRTIAAFAETCDVFATSVGECDRSFDFLYYEGAHLIRKYVVDSPNYGDRRLVEDFGDPFPDEAAAFELPDEMTIIMEIAASLRLKTRYEEQDLRIYAA
jgi:hypothetical protein